MEHLVTRSPTTAGRRRTPVPLLLALALLALAALWPTTAVAKDGPGGGDRPEVRVAGVCGKGASSKLKLKADDGAIEAEFEVDHNRSGTQWRVVFVHERRVVYRGHARTRGSRGSWSVEERLADLPGSDQIMARAVGPRGLTCQATAVLPG
jgi:hypothetical protein